MDDLLQQGMTAYQAGEREKARRLFIAHVKKHLGDEAGWGWLFMTCDQDSQRMDCLKQILRINPDNEWAASQLEKYAYQAARTDLDQGTEDLLEHAFPPRAETSPAEPAVPPPVEPGQERGGRLPSPVRTIGNKAYFFTLSLVCMGAAMAALLILRFSPLNRLIPGNLLMATATMEGTLPAAPAQGEAPAAAHSPTLPFAPTSSLTPTLTIPPTRTLPATLTPTPTLAFTPSMDLSATPGLPALSAECLPRASSRELATVVGITDGDTIQVSIGGQTFKVRYIGIDTPEINEYYFNEAKAANAGLVEGKQVLLVGDVSETDRYERLLRYVLVGEVFVNDRLVKEGYARANAYPPDTACASFLEISEQSAQSAGLGFWFPTPNPRIIVPLPTSAVCDCSANVYDCGDFASHTAAQACFNSCISQGAGDIHQLDPDADGVACESLP